MQYPKDVIQGVISHLDAELPMTTKVMHYAGELFTPEDAEALSKSVKMHPHVLVDLESLIPSDDASERQRQSDDQLFLNFFCCASSRRSPEKQMIESYQLANDVRKILTGYQIAALDGVHSNSFMAFVGMQKEFHGLGMSVHSVNMFTTIQFDLDS